MHVSLAVVDSKLLKSSLPDLAGTGALRGFIITLINREKYRKHFKYLFENYNFPICEITMQGSLNSADSKL